MIYTKTSKCRICASSNLETILDLGQQYLTGMFPAAGQTVEKGPLELVKCSECHLVQMAHSYDMSQLYGENYGYRSGLNASMVEHLKQKVKTISRLVEFKKDDLVVDIGSNDGTTLGHYEDRKCTFVGIDPSGSKFKKYYKPDVQLIPDFFSSKLIQDKFPGKKAKVVTSIAMFYDLENPIQFAKEIASILDENGVWVFEQSYLPLMIETLAYDTVCHEHLEYYGLHQVQKILEAANLKIIEVELNDVNGGSFSITAGANSNKTMKSSEKVAVLLEKEKKEGYLGMDLYKKYAKDVFKHRDELKSVVREIRDAGQTIHAYGASTKGNVILQFCGFGTKDIAAVAEVNEDKFGKFTPGTQIPIISEADSKAKKPNYYLVMPWHFKKNILSREKKYILEQNGKFIFPLPHIHVVSKDNLNEHLG
ncbi:MAG: class I SAM-dependent methyltransferase [Bdellovibrionota bacterium]